MGANNVCKNKKCQRILPAGYKYKYCEACRNEKAHGIKKVGGTVLTAGIAIASVAITGVKNIKK